MSNRYWSRALIGALVLTACVAANAKDAAVSLTGSEEVPAVTTAAKGTGTITIGADKSVTGSIKTKGIAGVAGHIHEAPKGKNGPPIITLEQKGDEWVVPAGSKLTDAQYESYKAGNLYVNIHSAEHKGGEIRAQLAP